MKNKAYIETILEHHCNVHLQASQYDKVSTLDIQWLTIALSILMATLDFNGNCVKNTVCAEDIG